MTGKCVGFSTSTLPKTALLQHPTPKPTPSLHDVLGEQTIFKKKKKRLGNGIIETLGLPDSEEQIDSRVRPTAMGGGGGSPPRRGGVCFYMEGAEEEGSRWRDREEC